MGCLLTELWFTNARLQVLRWYALLFGLLVSAFHAGLAGTCIRLGCGVVFIVDCNLIIFDLIVGYFGFFRVLFVGLGCLCWVFWGVWYT